MFCGQVEFLTFYTVIGVDFLASLGGVCDASLVFIFNGNCIVFIVFDGLGPNADAYADPDAHTSA